MSRLDVSETFLLKMTSEEGLLKVQQCLLGRGWLLEQDRDGTAWFSQGSQTVTRLFGGWFVPYKYLPAKAYAYMAQNASVSALDVRFEEALGVGLLDRMFAERYRKYFNECMADIRAALG
jgi:hypothetical protein